jgi:hypothetical protein
MNMAFKFIAALACIAAEPAAAHHSFAKFDQAKSVTLTGTVKQFQWTNPHCWIQLMVKDGKGKVVEWSIEATSPNILARQGWKRSSLKAGDQAVIIIHPTRDGSAGGALRSASVGGKRIGTWSGDKTS